MRTEAPRIMVAGTASGVGKTSLTCGLMRAFVRRGLRVHAFKCGPDYLDPMFHEQVLGVLSRNLDLFLGDGRLARRLVAQGAAERDLAVMEGVMGYYDGIAQGTDASSHHVAMATRTPALLVVDARGRSVSAAAEVLGFLRLREPSLIAGVLLNRVSAGYYPTLRRIVEREAGVPVVGHVPTLDTAALRSRHLGLVSAREVGDLQDRMDALADAIERSVDLDAVLELAARAPALDADGSKPVPACAGRPVVAVADDEAFCFRYADSLRLLERLGARLVPFSPMADRRLPRDASGLYLCGGYPELHARELSANESMRRAVREAVEAGMPTVAECGGFMYLQQTLEDGEGVPWTMAGALPGHARRREGHGRFGYVTLTTEVDGLLARAGERLLAHEFHYWDSDEAGSAFWAQKPQDPRGWACAVSTPSLYAGFPHLYLPGAPQAAERFVRACDAWDAAKAAEGGADA